MTPTEEEDAFDRLSKKAAAETISTCEDIFEQTEQFGAAKIMFAGLFALPKFGQREHTSVVVLGPGELPPDKIEASIKLYVSAPTITGDHFDFAVFAYDHSGRLLGKEGWRRAVVEVENATSEAPELSTSFLGRGSRGKDVHSIRFTEGELLRDPWQCAVKIFDWASWSFG